MSQIVYQEALDPYHAAFRILRLRALAPVDLILPVDHVRILDFYMVFPFRLAEYKFRQEHVRFRKALKIYDDVQPYGALPDDQNLLSRMQPMQMAALATLARQGFIDQDALDRGLVARTEAEPGAELSERIAMLNAEHPILVEVLTALMTAYKTVGPDGIKRRSSLIEHRYDAVV